MFDLTSHIGRSALARQITSDVEAQSIAAFKEAPRNHLGASIIGRDCWRYSWNVFRWIKFEAFSGRMFRLFNRGHLEEARFIDRLRGIGCVVYDADPQTGKQFRIAGSEGHFGGSADSILYLAPQYRITEAVIGEFKTHNDKSFQKLKKEGVKKSKPEHFKQMSLYGYGYGIRYGLYCAVNKNDDELWFEIVELDWTDAQYHFNKADQIIRSQTPPPKIAETPAFFDCKYCAFAGNCHAQQMPEKNCRSCGNCFPIPGGNWHCQVFNAQIPDDVIRVGCDKWRSII